MFFSAECFFFFLLIDKMMLSEYKFTSFVSNKQQGDNEEWATDHRK